MQTFLSEPLLNASVVVLDSARLRKQFLEGWQILNAIAQTPGGGGSRVGGKVPFASNHPATNQWRGHERALEMYLWLCQCQLELRGEATEKVSERLRNTMSENDWNPFPGLPKWYKDESQRYRVMITHRYNLFRKDPVHYAQYEPEGSMVDSDILDLVCCPDKVSKHLAGKKTAHAPYYYPTH